MKGRMWKRMLAALAALALLAALGIWLDQRVLVVKKISVRGSGAVDEAAVARASGVEIGASMLRLRTDEIFAGVDGMGVVYLKECRRRFPDRLELTVAQRGRRAMVLCGDGVLVLDADGCAVECLAEAPDMDLLYLSGMEPSGFSLGREVYADEPRLDVYRRAVRALDAAQAQPYASEVDLSDLNALRVITRSGIAVELGDAEALEAKIALMQAAVADLESRGAACGTLHLTGPRRADYSPPEPPQLEN